MYCHQCGNKIPEEAKFCSNCGQPVQEEAHQKIPSKDHEIRGLSPSSTLQLKVIELTRDDFPSSSEKAIEGWEEGDRGGFYVGKEGSRFNINLPKGYKYSSDVRLQDTNSFQVKNKDTNFLIVGEEIAEHLHSSDIKIGEDYLHIFKNSIDTYLSKIFTGMKSQGMGSPRDFKLYAVQGENYWWCRASFSYKMSNAIYWKNSGYNLLGKMLIKGFGRKSFKRVGYENDKPYEEYKIMDFFCSMTNPHQPFFALIYLFDEISGGNKREISKTMNEISKSLDYDTN